MNDLDAVLVEGKCFPGRIHAGFLSSVMALWPWIKEQAEKEQKEKPLVLTGHSKGGAIACLAGYLLRAIRPYVVTFGAPRFADQAFAEAYEVPTFRFQNPADRVTGLPPWPYWSCGMTVTAPPSFRAPSGLIESHFLETGYRPWVV